VSRLLVADDHAIVRKGVQHILEDVPGIGEVVEAGSGADVLDLVGRRQFDVLILDIGMPGMDGLDVLKHVKQLEPDLAVLIFSMFSEEQYAVRVLKAGAAGYLTKDKAPDELATAVRRIAAGRKYVSPSLAEKLADDLMLDVSKQPHQLLSDREFQVMVLIARGRTVGDIAQALNLSVKTVSTYRVRTLQKLGLKSNAELARYAIKNDLVE
jgi:DNA-binding NarL/FixJ family response regulator